MKAFGFFAMASRMKLIARWGLMRNAMKETLSEHSFDTAVIAHALANIGSTYFGKQVDAGEVAAAALFHDMPEILTGDMPAPVKHHNPEIRSAYKGVEATASKSLLSMLPRELRPKYEFLFAFDVEKPELYIYIKAADKISAYLKCIEELKYGNHEFTNAANGLREAVHALGLPEADYYMAHFAPAFELTLDELQAK